MPDELTITINFELNGNQLFPDSEELEELEQMLCDCIDSYLDRIAEDLETSDEDDEQGDA